ncbi:protein-tyrosine phosphatase family protein [Actinocrispum wychmicini]|uniref:protein-tyrosine-phosphatase n=1 Tax=Actinocrispum wychmicini TaxID=1213861 RepID=A0A4R2IVR1_9PSEU|nr:dual specificity protein phosphatase family protein [Actinocrispum wychmicini]TCO49763.1 dual specificity protein phosphatase-like protein [Actinocrispum wychmicini]
MRTRQQDRDLPGPGPHPWNEIRPHLWMGGHFWTDPSGELQVAVVRDEFEVVASLHTQPGHGPGPGVNHRILEIPDDPLTAAQIDQVRRLAEEVAESVQAGRTTLVRCYAGLNRSGLVTAHALTCLGMDVGDAITLIRRQRSPFALHNSTFEDYLRTGLAVAGLDSA